MKTRSIILGFLMTILLVSSAQAMDIKKASRDDLKKAFDVVAQNAGAVENAFRTFTLEFERAPENVDEMIKTGHLRVVMKNPYTEGDVKFFDDIKKTRAGNIYYKKLRKTLAEFSYFYVDPNNWKKTRSMNSTIVIWTQEELHKAIFGDNATREEQLTRVYLLQMDESIENYQQKTGHMPDSIAELAEKGDNNVDYINPFTNKPIKQSETLSPGDYFYRKFTKKVMQKEPYRKENGEVVMKNVEKDEEFYEIVGWGKTEPVYYYSNDRSKDELKLDNYSPEKNIREILDEVPKISE